MLSAVELENTFTDFFVRLMNGLFKDEGLLFIDSAFKQLREIEKNYFVRLIEESGHIAEVISKKEELFDEKGYGLPLALKLMLRTFFTSMTQDGFFSQEKMVIS